MQNVEIEPEHTRLRNPHLRRFHVFQVSGFISACRDLLPSIRQGWRDQGHNSDLPLNIKEYLSTRLKLDEEGIRTCWKALLPEILKQEASPLQQIMAPLAGSSESIGQLNALDLRTSPRNTLSSSSSPARPLTQRRRLSASRTVCAPKRSVEGNWFTNHPYVVSCTP